MIGDRGMGAQENRGGKGHGRREVKRRDYIDKRVTSPTWGSPPPHKRLISCMSKKGFGHTHIQLL